MKSNKIKFSEKITFDLLLKAYYRAIKNKTNRLEVLRYQSNLEVNISKLVYNLRNNNYNVSKYSSFTIYEPKKREIRKLKLIDRIIHQWYIEEFIKPYYLNRFITDTYACIPSKGNIKVVKKLQYYMRLMYKEYKNYYIIKMDIRNFFYTIDKEILFNILKRDIKDKELLSFTYKLIYENNEEEGLPIGNYTSQYFANIYLNELDKYIKEVLKIKYYLRYMDDFIILTKTKDDAKNIFNNINKFLKEKLNLNLNYKSNYFPNTRGIVFCGYKIYEDHLLIKRINYKRFKLRLYLSNDKYITIKTFNSYIKHSNNYNLIKNLT